MSSSERADFENELMRDPLLKNEFDLQRDIINSIKAYRKAELKSRLDNIVVNPAPFITPLAKIAASIAVGSLAVWGSYYYLKPDAPDVPQVTISAETQESELIAEFIPHRPEVAIVPTVEETPSIEIAAPAPKPTTVPVLREIRPPETFMPDTIEAFKEAAPQFTDEGILKPEISASIALEGSLPEILVNEAPDKKNRFYYQNYDGKLYLYGDFSAAPYLLIELNTETDRQLFLNYNEEYFLIKPVQKEVTPLTAIHDSALVNQLNALKQEQNK